MTGVVLPDEVVSEAMRSDVTWDRLVAVAGADVARANLIRLRTDVRQQRSIRAALMACGELSSLEYNRWLAKSTAFDRALTRRLARMQVNSGNPASDRTAEHTSGYYMRRHKADVLLVETLALAVHRYLEDDELEEDVLEDALDAVVDLGKLGEMPLREAIERQLIPSSGRVRDGSGS